MSFSQHNLSHLKVLATSGSNRRVYSASGTTLALVNIKYFIPTFYSLFSFGHELNQISSQK